MKGNIGWLFGLKTEDYVDLIKDQASTLSADRRIPDKRECNFSQGNDIEKPKSMVKLSIKNEVKPKSKRKLKKSGKAYPRKI